jgi:REP element-mobilizing transposase RayT
MSRPRRLDRFDYQGFHRYSLTICAHERREVFKDPTTVDLVTEQIRYTADEQQFEIPAYCFCTTTCICSLPDGKNMPSCHAS